jgi:acyl-CoA thioesterase-1
MVKRTSLFLFLLAVLCVATGGCDGGGAGKASKPPEAPAVSTAGAAGQPDMDTRTPTTGVTRLVFLGDSLTAGYGIDAEEAFPALIEARLKAEGTAVRVINAGVSGDTSAGGLRRLDWVLRQSPDVLVVGLGANDGLRGTDVATTEANLRQIVTKAQAAGARVLLLGMLMPPNFGPEYTTRFRELYPRVAKETNAALVPFMLEGVAGQRRYNQPDGVHPTAEGHRIIAEHVLPFVKPLVARP